MGFYTMTDKLTKPIKFSSPSMIARKVIYASCLLTFFLSKGFSDHLIVLTSMPKSGSSFLSTALARCISGNIVAPYIGGNSEQEFQHHLIQPLILRNAVTHAHAKATDNMLGILETYSLSPIVQFRNLIDITCSLHDHFLVEGNSGNPMQDFEKDWFLRKSKSERYDFIIDLMLPWYLNFYAGWMRAVYNKRCSAYIVWYEDLYRNPVAIIEDILIHVGHPLSRDEISHRIALIPKENTRFNRGIIGRGFDELTTEQISRIRKLASYYIDCPPYELEKLCPTHRD